MFWSGLALTLALSIDGFVVGFLYGMRRITLPWKSLALLGLCTAAGMTVSMVFGDAASDLLSPHTAEALGGTLLIALGVWQLAQGWMEYLKNGSLSASPGVQPLIRLQIKPLGIIVHILVDPTRADTDRSGTIELREALALGLALGLDTLGAGFAAAMLGFGPLLVFAVTLGLVILVWAGTFSGRRVGRGALGWKGMLMPGALLIVMGILHI